MQRSGVYAELRWGNQALKDGGHPCLIVSAILPTFGSCEGPFSDSKEPSTLELEEVDQNISAEDVAEI